MTRAEDITPIVKLNLKLGCYSHVYAIIVIYINVYIYILVS